MAQSELVIVTQKLLGWDTTRAKPKPVVLTRFHEPVLGAILSTVANEDLGLPKRPH